MVLFGSCSSDQTSDQTNVFIPVKTLLLPEIETGLAIDSTMPSIRIFALKDSLEKVINVQVESSDSLIASSLVVNIYADKHIASGVIDSIIASKCEGKDLRLVGIASGIELTIPFHFVHRFRISGDSLTIHQFGVDTVQLSADGVMINHSSYSRSTTLEHFKAFYGDAFEPKDSLAFPQRKPNRQNITSLELAAMAWDESEKNTGPDSAIFLAAYNEFVNRLEIFQKVGGFHIFPLGFIDFQVEKNASWGNVVYTLSLHRSVQVEKREEAKRFLADKQANDGNTDKQYEFTEEDLLLLYPDRLRWNGRMSGPTENLNDPFHLRVFFVHPPIPVAIVRPDDMVEPDAH